MSRFVKMPLRRNGRPGIIRYVASRASWMVASIVLASGLLAGTPARALLTVPVITSFEFVDPKVSIQCCVFAGVPATGAPMFFVRNAVTAEAQFDPSALSIELSVEVSFAPDDAAPLPTLADPYIITLFNTGSTDLLFYNVFAGDFGPANFAYAPDFGSLLGTYTATVMGACVDSGLGCIPIGFTPAVVSASFRVSEPTTLAIFGLGLVGLGFFMRRRRRVPHSLVTS